jgi:type IV pilus assembly protein PilM
MNSFGLDIGTSSIKAIVLRKEGKTISLEAAASSPIVGKGIVSESVTDQNLLADSIKKMLSEAGIAIKQVNTVLSESQIFSRVIELPKLSEQELQAAVRWEMEQNIPLPLSQVKTDWQVLGELGAEGKTILKILLVAAPTFLIKKYENILTLAGLAPLLIETETTALYRSLSPLFTPSEANMMVNIGASTTSVAIINNRIIDMIFSIPVGGIAITRALVADLGVDISQAEDLKKTYGLSEQVFEGKVGKALLPLLSSIAADIKKAMLLFKEKNNQDIKQIVLTGGSALIPGLDIYFASLFGTQVVIGNAWEANNILNVPQDLQTDAPAYNVVIGAALAETSL